MRKSEEERVIRIFPNTQSAFRLIGAVLMDYAEEVSKRIIKDNAEEEKEKKKAEEQK